MLKALGRWWESCFLEERPSLSLSLFRVALAATVGLHIIPTLLHMDDNYLSTAFREYNPSFFTVGVLAWVDGHPDWAVWSMAWLFLASWAAYLTGLFTRWSGFLMAIGCYYFYARNSLHIGTLSYDILLVTVFLMLVTPYPGDSFSLDSLLRGDPDPYRRRRPIFLQRLLQLQVAFTYFYTGLYKCTAEGNWLTANPYYYLMHTPPMGVMKQFPLRSFLGDHPDLCYALGVVLLSFEMTLPLWLFWKRTRLAAVVLAIAFQVMLLFTMHVPTIFLFLFPPQLLLFVDPEDLLGWLEKRRAAWAERGRDKLIYDGACGFCRACLRRIQALDPTGRLEPVDFRTEDVGRLHGGLTPEACHARIHLLESDSLSGGFEAFRRLSLRLPLLWPLAPILNFPGMRLLGEPVYAWVARNRFALIGLHTSHACRDNACLNEDHDVAGRSSPNPPPGG